jgi:rod shape-determining protein MreD
MRRSILIAVPVILLSVMVQVSIVSRIQLLGGSVDLLLIVLAAWGLQERIKGMWLWGLAAGLAIGLISAVPWYIFMIGYLITVSVSRFLAHRIWQAPLLAMFLVTFIGTLVIQLLTYLERTLLEVSIPFNTSFSQVILPSILLNLLLAILIHAISRRLAERLFPESNLV